MKIVIVGAGRIGTRTAQRVARLLCKKDTLKIIDRDTVTEDSLAACPLFSKKDIGHGKAQTTAKAITSAATFKTKTKPAISWKHEHLNHANAGQLLSGATLVLDCTDNWQARETINEHGLDARLPWVYAGALDSHAMTSVILPGKTACFACWASRPKTTTSCSAIGVDEKAVVKAAKKQASQAAALIAGQTPSLAGKLWHYEAKTGKTHTRILEKTPNCTVCGKGKTLLKENKPIVCCGTGEWLFLNKTKNKRKLATATLLKKLKPLGAQLLGNAVKISRENASALVFPAGRTMVRARTERVAAALNKLIVRRL